MPPDVTKSFQFTKTRLTKVVGLKLCSDCLSLSIFLLHKNRQPFERDRQKLCVVQKRGKLQLHCSKCWLKENCGRKSVVAKTSIF